MKDVGCFRNGEIESSSTEKKSTWHREDVPENNNTSLSQRPSAATSAVDPPISTQPPETLLSKSEIQVRI